MGWNVWMAASADANYLTNILSTGMGKRTAMENKQILCKVVWPCASGTQLHPTGCKKTIGPMTRTTAKFFGATKNLLDGGVAAAINADPTKQWWFQLYISSNDGGTALNGVIGVRARYHIVFFEPTSVQPNAASDINDAISFAGLKALADNDVNDDGTRDPSDLP